MIECVTEGFGLCGQFVWRHKPFSPEETLFFCRETMADDGSETESGLMSNGTIYTLSFTPSWSLTSVRNFPSDNTSKLMITFFYVCTFSIMSAENVRLAIRRDIELAFVKKAKIEFKGDRSEVRILVSTTTIKFSVFLLRWICLIQRKKTRTFK